MDHPEPDGQRRAAALAKAAATRRARTALQESLRRGDRDLAQLLGDAENDPILGRMRVSELLEALPVVGGTASVSQIMTAVGIAPTRRVRALTAAQRSALLQRFSDPGTVG